MIGIYLLVSIFAQLAPTNLASSSVFSFANPNQQQAINVEVSFDSLNGVKLGTPVLAEGKQVGEVTKIIDHATEHASNTKAAHNSDTGSFKVEVKITPQSGMTIVRGTVALQTAPISVSRSNPETVVELFAPPKSDAPAIKSGEKLLGFSSCEKFWKAESIKSWF